MRLVCLHADTVEAMKLLRIPFDDLTPSGLWSSKYHLVGLTREQLEALEIFPIDVEDITPAPLSQAVSDRPSAQTRQAAAAGTRAAAPGRSAAGPAPAAAASSAVREVAGGAKESEIPLAQARDAGTKSSETKADTRIEPKPSAKTATEVPQQTATPQRASPQTTSGQQPTPAQKGGKTAGVQTVAPAQVNRKGQPSQSPPSGGQRYGTTRLRISVAGKYTEAIVANGKIMIGNRSFDSPDEAAAELTKSRGDWTFWEYYDSADGKWRMLTRDWDTVLKSAVPGGR
jgi:hypothetical protein